MLPICSETEWKPDFGRPVMNFDEYEKKYETRYAEFARIVRDILEKAINGAEGIPRPQSIQCRAKETSHLKPKLEARGLLESSAIEDEIKDLAGARLIFYTNTDVESFLNSRLIPENFEVHWDQTRIHHPTEENANQRYRAIHYTVSLNKTRSALAEYAKFKGLWCEIQIQTVLIHAWAETSHDITYKRFHNKGFGQRAMASIEARLNKIMDEYLLPAGYDFQKVQHDFQRLMQGKQLFDRGTIEALDASANNNERQEILRSLREYVLPNYDDIAAIYPELRAALLRAVRNANVTEIQSIETPFGNIDGHTAADINRLVIGIISDLRYVDVGATLRALGHIYHASKDADVRREVDRSVEELARYDLDVWRQAGPAVQLELVSVIDGLAGEERDALWPVLHTVWRECLTTELRGTSWSAEAVTISSGAVPAVDELKAIRRSSIDGLLEFYDKAPNADEKRSILSSLWTATRLPSQANYSNDLCAMVISDTKRVVDEITARAAVEPYEVLEHAEHHLLFEHHGAQQIASAADDRFGRKALARDLDAAILNFRDAVNADVGFVRYKTLVGYESVMPPQWDDEGFDYVETERYRRERIAEYVETLSDETENEWYATIERCAATKSNDMATFPFFGEFLVLLAKHKPEMAERFLLRANDDVLNFLTAFLKGLYDSGDRTIYHRTVIRYLDAGTHLTELCRQWRLSVVEDEIKAILDRAIAVEDDIAVMECVVAVITRHNEDLELLVGSCFEPGLRYLTARNEARWVNGAWSTAEAKAFFAQLSAATTELVLENLMAVPRIDTHAEWILAYIASGHAAAVWTFLGRRILDDQRGRDHGGRYEAIPYQFHRLPETLSQDAASAVRVTRGLYTPDDTLFQFRGARLLSAMFPAFPDNLAHELTELAAAGTDDDVGFILQVLRAYQGQQTTHEVVRELVARLPEDDQRLEIAEICLQSTGGVAGEFGLVEAYRARKAQIETWLSDPRPQVRRFAERFTRRLEQSIAAEQRRAEEDKEMRRRRYEDPE
jgi:ppGpp synthetase/RelA/SpoT-type nucleotidyltranferase